MIALAIASISLAVILVGIWICDAIDRLVRVTKLAYLAPERAEDDES